jgi:hypothetical protein
MLAQPLFPAFGLGIKEIFDRVEKLLPRGVCLHVTYFFQHTIANASPLFRRLEHPA